MKDALLRPTPGETVGVTAAREREGLSVSHCFHFFSAPLQPVKEAWIYLTLGIILYNQSPCGGTLLTLELYREGPESSPLDQSRRLL